MWKRRHWIHFYNKKNENSKLCLTCVPTVMLGIEEMPALDFGFLFLALAFSSIFFRWLKGTTPLQTNASSEVSKQNWHSYLSLTYTVLTLYGQRHYFAILAKCQVSRKIHIVCYRFQLCILAEDSRKRQLLQLKLVWSNGFSVEHMFVHISWGLLQF